VDEDLINTTIDLVNYLIYSAIQKATRRTDLTPLNFLAKVKQRSTAKQKVFKTPVAADLEP